MEDKTITIPLSASQRELLLEYRHEFTDPDLLRVISIAVKKGSKYEITATADNLVDLCDQIESIANAEEDPSIQDKLDDLDDYLEEHLEPLSLGKEFGDIPSCSSNTGAVYHFKVALEGDSKIWRTIAIRGGQTLDDLHDVIFDAFDRDEEHLYSFYLPDKPSKNRPRRIHEVATEYIHPDGFEEGGFYDGENFNAAATTIDSMGLHPGQVLYYLFDFGDEWWHTITVEKTDGTPDSKRYPRIIERKGKSPEQYPDWEEEEE